MAARESPVLTHLLVKKEFYVALPKKNQNNNNKNKNIFKDREVFGGRVEEEGG